MKYVITFLLLLLLVPALYAQEDSVQTEETYEGQDFDNYSGTVSPDSLPSTGTYKSEKVELKKFNEAEWKKIVGNTNFDEEPPKEEKVANKPRTRSSPWGGTLLRIVSYIFVIGLVIAILYYFFKNSSTGVKKVKDVVRAVDLAAAEEDIEKFDMESLLLQARSENNLRLIVRIYYLGLLKKLNEGGVIDWKKDKTNFDYLMELFTKKYFYEEMRHLTLAYELVWYGERALRQETFDKLQVDFERVHEAIKNTSPA